jgi:hypothetical protein
MAEACYTARATTKQQVLNVVNKLTLQTNEHGQYMLYVILLLQKGIWHMLISQFNPRDPGMGVEKLLDDGNNLLMLIKSTNAITAGSVIKAAKKRADELTATTSKTILHSITAQTEAQEEADQLNIINQSVIGNKEGVIEDITKLVGSNVTNAILQMADGSNHRSIDEFTLCKVMKVAINSAGQPSMNDSLEQLIEVINHKFDFHKKVSVIMELMQSNMAQMAMYGIIIGIPQLMLTLLGNIEMATKSNYGREFCSTMHAIHKMYTYNHVYNAALLQIILKEMVGADSMRILKDALASGAGTAHSVAKLVSYLQAMMGEDTNSAYTKLVYSVNSDSNSSEGERKPRGRNCKKFQRSKLPGGCRKQKEDKDDEPKKNMCPHCKKLHHKKPHQVEQDRCMWNKKYKGYHFKSISDELEVVFKPCHKVSAEIGRYASKGNELGDN